MDLTFKNDCISKFFEGDDSNPPIEEFKEAIGKPLVKGNFILEVRDIMGKVEKKVSEGGVGPNVIATITKGGETLYSSYKEYLEIKDKEDADQSQIEGSILTCLYNLRLIRNLGNKILEK